MINLIGNAPESNRYRTGTWEQFVYWVSGLREYQLDIETTIDEYWMNKKIMCIQFGDVDGRVQWVLQWSALSIEQKFWLKLFLENRSRQKLIHNAMFECIVLLFHAIRIDNVYDTMLAELIMNTGMDFEEENTGGKDKDEAIGAAGYYALTSLSDRYLCKRMDKSSQMLFGDDILTESKVIYATADVQPLGFIRTMQLQRISSLDLEYVLALENAVVPAFAEMTYTGMLLNTEKWRENINLAVPVITAAKEALDAYLSQEPFVKTAIERGFISNEDRVTINWNSPKQKQEIVEHFFPFLIGRVGKPVLSRMLKAAEFSDPMGREIVQALHDGDWAIVNKIVLEADREWLINHDYVIPAGTGNINWNSPDKALEMLHCIRPKMHNTNAETMSKFTHPIGKALTGYRSALKLLSTYGENFITDNLEPDGRIRTTFRQIKSTGRVSSSGPNMQNIIVDESVGTRYRNAFECGEDEVYCSSDFTGQELVIMTFMSQEPVFLEAIRKGQDLHSICAELIYKKKWKDAAAEDCAYYKLGTDGKPQHQKCNCKAHKVMRVNAKTLNFGIPYGMSEFKLGGALSIPVSAAKAIMDEHERTFPKLWRMIRWLSKFGITKGYIMTLAPFFRKRWFPYWVISRNLIEQHLQGQFDANLAAIEREAGNMPIQGSGGDMCKLAMVLMYEKIHYSGRQFPDGSRDLPVKLAMQVHDQIDTHVRKDFSEEWKPIMHQCMLDAALVIIPNGMLGADTAISPFWTK